MELRLKIERHYPYLMRTLWPEKGEDKRMGFSGNSLIGSELLMGVEMSRASLTVKANGKKKLKCIL